MSHKVRLLFFWLCSPTRIASSHQQERWTSFARWQSELFHFFLRRTNQFTMISLVRLILFCLVGSAVAMVMKAPKQPPPVPSFNDRQFQRLQPLEQAAIPAIGINPVHRPNIKEQIQSYFNDYVRLLERKPLVTKSVSAAVVGGIGDVLSQSLTALSTRTRFQWDIIRTVTFMLIGLCYRGPLMHAWFNALEKMGQSMKRLTSPMQKSLAVVAIDQTLGVIIFHPLYYVAHELFSSFMSFRGKIGSMQAKMQKIFSLRFLTQILIPTMNS